MKVKAYGKINLSLYITGRRGGLHTLDSVMTTVTVCDELTVDAATEISVACGGGIGRENNIAYRAARLVEEACGLKLRIAIEKGIPVGGGLGGSSADGAAVLFCAAELLKPRGDRIDLRALASRLGSDVYFMTRGGSCRVGGCGDVIEPIACTPRFSALLIDCGGVSTPECYRRFDMFGGGKANRNDALIGALSAEKPLTDEWLDNDLFAAARSLNPRIAAAEKSILAAGVVPHLTGSGGCLFVLSSPESLAGSLRRQGFTCTPVAYAPRGVEITDER